MSIPQEVVNTADGCHHPVAGDQRVQRLDRPVGVKVRRTVTFRDIQLTFLVDSVVRHFAGLVDKERPGNERSEEGSKAESEVDGVHVWAAVPALPDVEDDHVAGRVHIATPKAADEGADVDGDEVWTVGIGGQWTAHERHSSC